ncbi:MAG: enoyl-CoA hydratase/isomerase family protein [Proteobacteria bacterium]|nr:enoyl-CoA hydratase/isomerase family protein [Pseudomonadota bacterium]
MSDPVVTVEEAGGDTLIVRLNRPHKRNALSSELKRELAATAHALAERTDIGAIILAGAGGAFCAGNDISQPDSFAQELPLVEARRHIRLGLEMCRAWEALPQLTIAAVDRFAIGGGISLALSCDFRILQTGAWLRAPEVELGITYSWGTLPRLVRLVGPARAKLIAGLCRRVDAATALDWGLCEEVSDDTMAAALVMAAEITAKPRVAQQMIKESVNRLFSGTDTATLEQDQVLLNMTSSEARAAQAAALTKISG